MLRKALASLAAVAVFAATFTPVDAAAQRHGYYDRDYRDHHRGRRHHRDRDDNGDAAAAAVVGLIVGVALGSLASQQQQNQRVACRDNYRSCAAPDPYYDRQSAYDPRYDDGRGGSAYEREYGVSGDYDDDRPCVRSEERWDQRSGGYITVRTPC